MSTIKKVVFGCTSVIFLLFFIFNGYILSLKYDLTLPFDPYNAELYDNNLTFPNEIMGINYEESIFKTIPSYFSYSVSKDDFIFNLLSDENEENKEYNQYLNGLSNIKKIDLVSYKNKKIKEYNDNLNDFLSINKKDDILYFLKKTKDYNLYLSTDNNGYIGFFYYESLSEENNITFLKEKESLEREFKEDSNDSKITEVLKIFKEKENNKNFYYFNKYNSTNNLSSNKEFADVNFSDERFCSSKPDFLNPNYKDLISYHFNLKNIIKNENKNLFCYKTLRYEIITNKNNEFSYKFYYFNPNFHSYYYVKSKMANIQKSYIDSLKTLRNSITKLILSTNFYLMFLMFIFLSLLIILKRK